MFRIVSDEKLDCITWDATGCAAIIADMKAFQAIIPSFFSSTSYSSVSRQLVYYGSWQRAWVGLAAGGAMRSGWARQLTRDRGESHVALGWGAPLPPPPPQLNSFTRSLPPFIAQRSRSSMPPSLTSSANPATGACSVTRTSSGAGPTCFDSCAARRRGVSERAPHRLLSIRSRAPRARGASWRAPRSRTTQRTVIEGRAAFHGPHRLKRNEICIRRSRPRLPAPSPAAPPRWARQKELSTALFVSLRASSGAGSRRTPTPIGVMRARQRRMPHTRRVGVGGSMAHSGSRSSQGVKRGWTLCLLRTWPASRR